MIMTDILNCDIRNVFTIERKNIDTGEVKTYKAHNIILDAMYTRLCNFQSYFANIHFGTGTGDFNDPARTSLYTHLGTKTAVEEFQTPAYPTSQWRKRITLLPEEYVGATITEVGVAYGSTASNLVTHAPIRDAEGNPIVLGPKLANEVITIYADIFVTLYAPDPGVSFIADGLRNYLLGATMASEQMAVSFGGISYEDATEASDYFKKSAARTVDVANRKVTSYCRFQASEANFDIRYIDWVNVGLRVELPRPGVDTGRIREGVVLGAGDGLRTYFPIPNKNVSTITAYVDNIETAHTMKGAGINIDPPPATGLVVTADYFCPYMPKDSNHVADYTFALTYGISEPPAKVEFPPPPSAAELPGSSTLVGGDATYGFYGEVPHNDFISGEDLCDAIGLTAGELQHSTEPWLKFALDGKIIYVAKKTYRHSISWNDINAVGAVTGAAGVWIDGRYYAVKLLSTTEWDALMYPIHVDHPSGAPVWANYTDEDLLVRSTYGNGSYTWTRTKSGTNRVSRGYGGVAGSYDYTPSSAYAGRGFRPVLSLSLCLLLSNP